MKARVTEGPARSAIAAAVLTKSPAPMIAPMPRAMSATGPSVRLRVPSPVARDSASSPSIDLVLKRLELIHPPRDQAAPIRHAKGALYLLRDRGDETARLRLWIRGQEVGDDSQARRPGGDDACRTIIGDAADGDDRLAPPGRITDETQPTRSVAGVLGRGSEDRSDGDV